MGRLGMSMTRAGIAGGTLDKRTERKRIKADFLKARSAYQEAVQLVKDTLDQQTEYKLSIENHEANMKGMEQGWIKEGRLDKFTNETTRKAELQHIRETDEAYAVLSLSCNEAKAIVARNEATIQHAMFDIRIYRYDIEMLIAEGLMIAGERDDERHQV